MSLKKKMSAGEFAVMAEMHTPKGVDISEIVTNARRLKGRVDAVVIPDMDNGIMHMSALAGGVLMKQQGLEAMIHVYGRDRNRMALQGDLLAAHVLGISNLLVVRGEEMINGDHRDARIVDDLDEVGILNMIRTLQGGLDLAGFELKGAPEFTAGCAIAPVVDDAQLAAEIESAKKKVAAGAGFVVAPAVFDMAYYAKMIEKLKPLGVPVVATVFLLKNVGMARYMAINDPGARVSEDLITRIRKAPDREAECVRMAGEMAAALKKTAQGIKIVTLGWEHRLPAILESAGL
ncbi:MAG: 5,10-methylenetetrahydrofolate reductase [Desulfobacteraceae bacterium]|nr:MAG: 5,10-methylenetetrahydrofolate reductase [Desulfobacteraceae bacterium]